MRFLKKLFGKPQEINAATAKIGKQVYLINYRNHYEDIIGEHITPPRLAELFLFRGWTAQFGFRICSSDADASEKLIGETVNSSKYVGLGMFQRIHGFDIETELGSDFISLIEDRWTDYDVVVSTIPKADRLPTMEIITVLTKRLGIADPEVTYKLCLDFIDQMGLITRTAIELDVADELEKWYIAFGAFLRKSDLEAHETRIEEPVKVTYRGYTVYKCGPWTQGPTLLQSLRLLEGFDLKEMGHLSDDYIHVTTEAMKLAYADRDEHYGDPLFVKVPLDALFSNKYTQARRRLIDLRQASLERRPGDPSQLLLLKGSASGDGADSDIPIQDTTTCVVADRWGNFVAATPSCNLVRNRPGPSGVTQGNRVRCLNTTPNHPNSFESGKRPRITLTPTIVTKDGRPVLGIAVAGGDLQDQTTLNVLLNHIEFGMRPAEAVTAPRFSTSHRENSFDPNPDRAAAFGTSGGLQLSRRVSRDVRTALSNRGHKVSTASGPIAHPVMIYLDHETGKLYAAGDPTAGRHASVVDRESSQPAPERTRPRARRRRRPQQPKVKAAIDHAIIILVEAVRRAQNAVPGGRVYAAKLDENAYVIDILVGDEFRKVRIDSVSGKALKIEKKDVKPEDLRKAKRELSATRFTMWYALDAAMDDVDFGRPFEARLNNGDYKIKLFVEEKVVEKGIDAYTGR